MRTIIALLVGWAIGFGGAALFPAAPWVFWVAFGSALAFMTHWTFS